MSLDMRAWWSGDLTALLAAPAEQIVQRLAVRLVETHHLNHAAQLVAWRHLGADAVAHWFLDRWPDVRASDALELPATQFACQGLELDHVGLCWGNDLIRSALGIPWQARAFVGSAWQIMRQEAAIAYQVNTYRVLLTRARYETVIWIPRGDPDDRTRDPATFDAIARYLAACGASTLEETDVPTRSPDRIDTLL